MLDVSDKDATRILARMSTSRACRARELWRMTLTNGQMGRTTHTATDQSGKSVTSWTGKSPDTPDLLRTSSRGCNVDVMQKTVQWNIVLTK